jgi:hypothetical protein
MMKQMMKQICTSQLQKCLAGTTAGYGVWQFSSNLCVGKVTMISAQLLEKYAAHIQSSQHQTYVGARLRSL